MTIIFYSEKELRRKKGRQRRQDLRAKTEAERNEIQKRNSLIPFHTLPAEIHDDFCPPLQ